MSLSRYLALILFTALAAPALADTYAAVSNTASAITGDIELDDAGITFENGEQLLFGGKVGETLTVDGETVKASVYRVAEPGDPVLLNDNRLCGAPVTYVAAWDDERDLMLAVFSGPDAPASTESMCALFVYE